MRSTRLALSRRATLLDLALVNRREFPAGEMVRVTVHVFDCSV